MDCDASSELDQCIRDKLQKVASVDGAPNPGKGYSLGNMAYQFVLNKYKFNDGHHINPHSDKDKCYDWRYPIISLSYGHGAEMSLVYQKKRNTETEF